MRNRSRHEILKKILEIIQEPTKKTDIMYQVKLSYVQLMEYLRYMLLNELYNYNEQNKTYQLSERGKQVLDAFKRIPKMNLV